MKLLMAIVPRSNAFMVHPPTPRAPATSSDRIRPCLVQPRSFLFTFISRVAR